MFDILFFNAIRVACAEGLQAQFFDAFLDLSVHLSIKRRVCTAVTIDSYPTAPSEKGEEVRTEGGVGVSQPDDLGSKIVAHVIADLS